MSADNNNYMLNAQLQALLQQQQQQSHQQPQQHQQAPQQSAQLLAQLQQLQQMQGMPQQMQPQPHQYQQQQQQQPWNANGTHQQSMQDLIAGQMGYSGAGPSQQSAASQRFPSQQQQQQQQQLQQQAPWMMGGQAQASTSAGGMGGQGASQQPFNPFNMQGMQPQATQFGQHQQQQQQRQQHPTQQQQQQQLAYTQQQSHPSRSGPTQQQQGQMQHGGAGPSAYKNANMAGMGQQGMQGLLQQQMQMQNQLPYQQQQQQAQTQQQQQQQLLGAMPFATQDGSNFDASAFLNALNAGAGNGSGNAQATANESDGSAINPAMLLQQLMGQGNAAGAHQPEASGSHVSAPQRQASGTPGPQHASAPSPRAAPTPSSTSTPDGKVKGRPRGSTKKRREEQEAHMQKYQAQQHALQGQRPASRASQGPSEQFGAGHSFPQPAPSPAPSTMQTPTQMHSGIPLASPARAFAQMQERSRSQTRSPSLSGQHITAGTPGSIARPFAQQDSQHHAPQGHMPQGGPATNWSPSLGPQQQQQILSQALNIAKGNAMRAHSAGITAPQQTPAQILMQMGYVFIKANSLPNGGQGAGIPSNAGTGPGAVLTITEANAIGVFGKDGANAQQPQQGQAPQMPMMQQQQAAQANHFRPPQALQGPQGADMMAQMRAAASSAQLGQAEHQGVQFPPQFPQAAHPSMQQQPMPNGLPVDVSHNASQQGGIRPGARAPSASGSQAQPRPPTPVNTSNPQPSPAPKPKTVRSRQASSNTAASGGQQTHAPAVQGGPQTAATSTATSSAAPAFAANGTAQSAAPPATKAAPSMSQMAPAFENQPPVYGGRLPPKTKSGFDVSPEYNTRFTPLPPSDLLAADGQHYALSDVWKPMTKDEEEALLDIMRKDNQYTSMMSVQSSKINGEVLRRAHLMQPFQRLHWWEQSMDEPPREQPYEDFKVLLPADKRAKRVAQGPRSVLCNGMTPRKWRQECMHAATFAEDLVPIRIEVDHEGWKLRDTFTWPAPETFKTEMIDRFATALCEDIGLPIVHFVHVVRESIVSQVADHASAEAIRPVTSKRKGDLRMSRGQLSEDDMRWWAKWRKKVDELEEPVNTITDVVNGADDDDESSADIEGEMSDLKALHDRPTAELRIQIKLDITVGAMNLVDQFEWDVTDEADSAEQFATVFAADLGLSCEFRTAVAHSIREQVDAYVRSLVLVGYGFDGRDVYDDELRLALLPSLYSVARSDVEIDAYTPKLVQLSEAEIMQLEKEREREARRKRRQTRGRRGVNLPDREPLKTTRTPVVVGLQTGMQSVDGFSANALDTYASGRDTSASTRGAAGMSTRRAAAIVANASIASAAAHEFGTPTPAPEGPTVLLNGRVGDREAVKRRRLESYATHFEYPGGLGNVDDEADEERDRGPRFSLAEDEDLTRGPEPRAAELGGMPATSRQAKQILQGNAAETSTPGTPVPWPTTSRDEMALQVPNWHEGQWFCSNCGVPGSMDLTRRKGPLGEKTLCGICGKYFHRHRKSRPVEHTRDLQYHARELRARGIHVDVVAAQEAAKQAALLAQASATSSVETAEPVASIAQDDARQVKSEEMSNAVPAPASDALAAPPPDLASLPTAHIEQIEGAAGGAAPTPTTTEMSQQVAPIAAPQSEIVSESKPTNEETRSDVPAQLEAPAATEAITLPKLPSRGDSPELPFEQVGSPDDSESSKSSPTASPKIAAIDTHVPVPTRPLAEARSESPSKPPMPAMSSSAAPAAASPTAPAHSPSGAAPVKKTSAPDWLKEAFEVLSAQYPLDRFEFMPRRRAVGDPPVTVTEWRIRCNDCPGKLYVPGPGESLSSFEIHLKNRAHRANVLKAVEQEHRQPHES